PLFRPDTPAEYRQQTKDRLVGRLAYLARHLSDNCYLLGDQFTVADAYLYTVLGWGRPLGIDLAEWPSLLAFHERIGRRQSVVDALAAED
ncbi:MAG: glutathione S-transferase C-terminal domain-containing protein, partial [Candidatus Accumulibacter sp.]|nr:glutathione S-transferase C-terminal domain-containing protein [Accumulibacter sp.]